MVKPNYTNTTTEEEKNVDKQKKEILAQFDKPEDYTKAQKTGDLLGRKSKKLY